MSSDVTAYHVYDMGMPLVLNVISTGEIMAIFKCRKNKGYIITNYKCILLSVVMSLLHIVNGVF